MPISSARLCVSALLLLFALVVPKQASAQQHVPGVTAGWNFAQKEEWKYMRGPSYGFEYAWNWRGVYEDNLRKPFDFGVKADMAILPNGIAGNRFGVVGYATSPILFINRRLAAGELALECGAGLGFYPTPWESTHDKLNDFIGTYYNCQVEIGPVFTYPVNDLGALQVGFKFLHNSNGMMTRQNVGLNFIQGQVGWKFNHFDRSPQRAAKDMVTISSRHRARTGGFVAVAGGLSVPRSSKADNKDLAPAYTVEFGWRYAYQACRSVGIAIDFAYNFGDNFDYRKKGEPTPFPMFVGMCGLHETHWGPISLRAGMGFYIYESFEDWRVYERVGIFYHFGKSRHQMAGISVKANIFHADYVECTYGIDLW